MLNYSGLVYIDFIKPNSLAWCLVAELIILSALLTGRFRRALRQAAEQRLRRLREHEAAGRCLIAAQDEEREALARELHDALAPGLTALHLAWQGRLVRQALAQAPPLLAEAHQQTEALLRQLRHEVRAFSQVLLPHASGEPPPLPEALALLTETLGLAGEDPCIECVCDAAAAGVPPATQQAAYRIVAELLHNALRHARAQRVRVEVHRWPAALCLLVADDGQGFDPHGPPPRSGGLGLRGVQARAGYLRGQVQVVSQPGQGTRIEVELPL
jgi:signal transduction histidine kinase